MIKYLLSTSLRFQPCPAMCSYGAQGLNRQNTRTALPPCRIIDHPILSTSPATNDFHSNNQTLPRSLLRCHVHLCATALLNGRIGGSLRRCKARYRQCHCNPL